MAAQARPAGRTDRPGTERRAHGQAMPGEAARAELLLPEADGPGPRTGEVSGSRSCVRLSHLPPLPSRPAPSFSPVPLRPSPASPLPVPSRVLLASCPFEHLNPDHPTPPTAQKPQLRTSGKGRWNRRVLQEPEASREAVSIPWLWGSLPPSSPLGRRPIVFQEPWARQSWVVQVSAAAKRPLALRCLKAAPGPVTGWAWVCGAGLEPEPGEGRGATASAGLSWGSRV